MFGKFEAQFKSWEYLLFEFRSTECPHTLTPRVSVRSADSTALTRQPPASFATPARAPSARISTGSSQALGARASAFSSSPRKPQRLIASSHRRALECPSTPLPHRPPPPLAASLLYLTRAARRSLLSPS